jgi:hypothetical protein
MCDIVRLVARQPLRQPLTPAQHAQVTRTAKELDLFVKLQSSAPVERTARIEPSSKAFVAAAKYDYQSLVSHYGEAKLPAAFRVSVVPPEVVNVVKAFAAQHRGSPEVALNTIDGQRSFQVQVPVAERTHVLLLGARGQELARGEVKGAKLSWNW